MYTILNALTFFLVSGYAVKLLFSSPSYMKLSKKENVLVSGREKFLLLTIATGMLQTGVDLGMNLSSLRLLLWMSIIILAFLLYRPPTIKLLPFIYIVFLGWLLVSFFWGDSYTYAFRSFLKYLYPLLIMLFALTFVQSPKFIFLALKWMMISSFIVSIFLGGFMTHILGIWNFYGGGLFWPISTLADYLGIMSGVAFLMWWRTGEKKYLFLIGWFFLSATLQSVRTGLLAIFMVLMVASILRYKLLALPFITTLFLLAAASVVFIPQVHDKMFNESAKVSGINDLSSVSTDNIDSSARFSMWEWALNKFYVGNELMGVGIGSVQKYMTENKVFGGLPAPHNDYVQLLCDVGLVGLFLYVLFPLSVFLYAIGPLRQKNFSGQKISVILAVLSYTAVLTTMMVDNTVNYSFAAHSYPFIFVGLALAYKRIDKQERIKHV